MAILITLHRDEERELDSNKKELYNFVQEKIEFHGLKYFSSYNEIKDKNGEISNYIYTTYDVQWLGLYFSNNYFNIDPIITRGIQGNDIYLPSEDKLLSDSEREFLRISSEFGISGNIVAVPIHINPIHRGIVTLIFKDDRVISKYKIDLIREFISLFTKKFLSTHQIFFEKIHLTPREESVLKLAILGKTDAEIGASLGMARWTVVAHFQSIKHKLGVPNRAAAVAWAVENRVAYWNQ